MNPVPFIIMGAGILLLLASGIGVFLGRGWLWTQIAGVNQKRPTWYNRTMIFWSAVLLLGAVLGIAGIILNLF